MAPKPKLSLVIASYNAGGTIGACLEALRRQSSKPDVEIIVVDSSPDDAAGLVAARYPEVQLHRFRERKFPGEARNLGVARAHGEIIAFIDADCVAAPNWVAEILKAHQSPHPAIGGAIGNAPPGNAVGWAAYFCEFTKWMPGLPPRWSADIPTANMSYKREVFEKFGGFLEGGYCSDTEFHWRLGKQGYRLRFNPEMLVFHRSIDQMGRFLRHEYMHGRSFAQVRVRGQEFSPWRRFLYVTFAPLIPLKLFLDIRRRVFKTGLYRQPFIKTAPFLLLGLISWSWGECVGYLQGEARRGAPTPAGGLRVATASAAEKAG